MIRVSRIRDNHRCHRHRRKPTAASTKSDRALARTLLTAQAVRERAHEMLALCEAGRLGHWLFERGRLPRVAGYVTDTIRESYPGLDIPFHARWRHFAAGGHDRWAELSSRSRWPDAASCARAAFDLAIVSVLLDAGAGADWRYRLEDGSILTRSEGLAVASFEMFARGAFSADPHDKLRADASRLIRIEASDIAAGFQVTASNPLIGLEGRAALLRSLGRAAAASPSIFGTKDLPRPGGLFDHLFEMREKDAPSLPPRYLPPCSPISGRSGRLACRSAASRSATAGGTRPSSATTPPMGSSHSISSRNGSPIR